MQIPACPYVFVHENHPVINLLRINKSMVGVDVDEQHKMEGYVRVTNSLFDASCDAIQNRILDKIQTHNFNNLTVSCVLFMIFFVAFLVVAIYGFASVSNVFFVCTCRFSCIASEAWTGVMSMVRTLSCPSCQTPLGTRIR